MIFVQNFATRVRVHYRRVTHLCHYGFYKVNKDWIVTYGKCWKRNSLIIERHFRPAKSTSFAQEALEKISWNTLRKVRTGEDMRIGTLPKKCMILVSTFAENHLRQKTKLVLKIYHDLQRIWKVGETPLMVITLSRAANKARKSLPEHKSS